MSLEDRHNYGTSTSRLAGMCRPARAKAIDFDNRTG